MIFDLQKTTDATLIAIIFARQIDLKRTCGLFLGALRIGDKGPTEVGVFNRGTLRARGGIGNFSWSVLDAMIVI